MRCHAALIEDLLSDAFDFVLTSRFKRDPLQKRYVIIAKGPEKDFKSQPKISSALEKKVKIKTLVKKGYDIDSSVKVSQSHCDFNHLLQPSPGKYQTASLAILSTGRKNFWVSSVVSRL